MIEASAAALRGAHHDGEGVHFCVFSSCAERVEVSLFDAAHRETARHNLEESGDGNWRGFLDRKSTRLNSSHSQQSRMPSSA